MQVTTRCKQCKKVFNGDIVFDQVQFEMNQGEILSLVGPSGTGKSTLLRCIAGLEQLTSGQIFIEGIDVTKLPANKRPVVMMFQQTLLFPHMTVLENVTYGLKMRKIKKALRNKMGMELLEKIEMAEYANNYPFECSGGQQQRIALARALITKPKLLLLDEPFNSLDTDLRSTIRDWVRGLLKEEGITAIFVTHDKEEAMLMGDLVAVMVKEKIQQVGIPSDVYHKPKNRETAEFFSEGFVENNSFIPIYNLTMVPRKQFEKREKEQYWNGKIIRRFIKHGQSFDLIHMNDGCKDIVIPSNLTIAEEEEIVLSINKKDILQF